MKNPFNQKCFACDLEKPPVTRELVAEYMEELEHGWKISDDHKELHREFHFRDFKDALDFTVRVGKLAEDVQYHPVCETKKGVATIRLVANGDMLDHSDFLFASKIDKLDHAISWLKF